MDRRLLVLVSIVPVACLGAIILGLIVGRVVFPEISGNQNNQI
jgi:hypothetical protein